MSKSLAVMSLNVERMLQKRTLPYLQGLGIAMGSPDVLCLQDMPFRDLSLLKRWWPYVTSAPMANHLINGERAVVGIAILSRYPIMNDVCCTTWGNGEVKDLQGINDKNERFPAGPEADRLVEATEDRVAICVTVIKDGRRYNIATTHGFWVRGGVTNDQQRESTRRLIDFLSREGEKRDGLLLVGDMNFGRGGEIYNQVLAGNSDPSLVGGFTDLIPASIDNTLDPEHPAVKKGLKIVTDWFFSQKRHDRVYYLSDVQLHPGVSDHCALSAVIEIVYGL